MVYASIRPAQILQLFNHCTIVQYHVANTMSQGSNTQNVDGPSRVGLGGVGWGLVVGLVDGSDKLKHLFWRCSAVQINHIADMFASPFARQTK